MGIWNPSPRTFPTWKPMYGMNGLTKKMEYIGSRPPTEEEIKKEEDERSEKKTLEE